MRRILLGFLFLIAASVSAFADERITNFVSDATVNADSSLNVTETISLIAEGRQIRRGILRDFPTIYRDPRGTRVEVGFDVLGVKRNGRDEPYAVENISNGKRIRIGSANTTLSPGPHVYEISYRTTRQLGYFDGFDELYWNVTGNSWTFAIERAEAIIRLPGGAHILQHAEYTGRQGEQGTDYEVEQASGGLFKARTTRTLNPGEGFTVAVGWPKGFVTAPSETQKLLWFIWDNLGVIAVIIGVIGSSLYFFYAWLRVGRDPPAGTIIPLFTPPKGLGPAGMRYVWRQRFDDRAFAASLVGLAVKGRIKIIEDDKKDFKIKRLEDKGPELTRVEAALYKAVPAGTNVLKNTNHSKVKEMREAIANAVKNEYEGVAFLRNLSWFWTGVAVSAASLIVSALLFPLEDGLFAIFIAVWSSIWWGVILLVGWNLVKNVINSRGIMSRVASIFSMGFLLPFFIGGVAVPVGTLFSSSSAGLNVLGIGAIILAIVSLVFLRLLRAPTIYGRKLLDQIEGFRMYMTTAEENRLDALHPPEKTPELFERYLPYALALDCENQWNAKFAAVLAGAAAAPSWYSGHSWDSGRSTSFTDSLGSSLTSSTSSAAAAPGTSSGSFGGGGFSSGGGGGGGSSGGGGGGGGGSGW